MSASLSAHHKTSYIFLPYDIKWNLSLLYIPAIIWQQLFIFILFVCDICLFFLSVSKMKMIYFLFPSLFLNYKHVVINLESLDKRSQKGKSSRVGNSLGLSLVFRIEESWLGNDSKLVDQINCPGQGLSGCPRLIKHIYMIGGDCPSILVRE